MHEHQWIVKGGTALGPAPFFVAGIVNVTPDSFHDGGRFLDHGAAVARGLALAAEGAQILDVGGESTRPGAAETPVDEELGRVVPVIRDLAASCPAALSVDTYKARVAAEALAAGAVIVNDVSACRFDEGLVEVLVREKPGYVLMHSQGRPREMQKNPSYRDVVEELLAFFEERLQYLVQRGLPEERIVLDPGIGFGKTLEHNLLILKHIERFHALGRPLYVGLSHKALFQGLLGLGPGQRGTATQAATALLAAKGVAVHRVHDVADTVRTLTLAAAIA
jgi:dihydropteroate synthase